MILKQGDILRDRYKILQFISRGGMGSIYQAADTLLEGRVCAIKEVHIDPSLPSDTIDQTRAQFRQEANVLARLDHPNLPKVSDIFFTEDRDYLVMDYVPGKDLRTLMVEAQQRHQFLAERDVLHWAEQLANALNYMHSQTPPILHRDIKPSNLKLTPNGIIKLVDFGLVKILAPNDETVTIVQGRGTALYTPLEQYGGDTGHTDIRSDVYAFGATLYHLLTGEAPIEARERFLDPYALTSPRKINSKLSPRTERAILWAMNLHPADRPESMQIFRDSLFGDIDVLSRSARMQATSPTEAFSAPLERGLAWFAAILMILSLVATLTH